jgi:hypothetical protein
MDPLYKLIAGQNSADKIQRSENDNAQIAEFLLQFDLITEGAEVALFSSHYFAKGNPRAKNVLDRFSGAGSFNRDPDVVIMLTEHEKEDNAFTLDIVQRNFPIIPSRCVRWSIETMFQLAPDLDPADRKGKSQSQLRRNISKSGGRDKLISFSKIRDVMDKLGNDWISKFDIVQALVKANICSSETAYRILSKRKGGYLSSNFEYSDDEKNMKWIGPT